MKNRKKEIRDLAYDFNNNLSLYKYKPLDSDIIVKWNDLLAKIVQDDVNNKRIIKYAKISAVIIIIKNIAGVLCLISMIMTFLVMMKLLLIP